MTRNDRSDPVTPLAVPGVADVSEEEPGSDGPALYDFSALVRSARLRGHPLSRTRGQVATGRGTDEPEVCS